MKDRGRSLVRNSGGATAKDVHVRAGSAVDDSDLEAEVRAPSVAHGEGIRILVTPTFGSAKDYAVVVTWRGRFGRRERWTYPVH